MELSNSEGDNITKSIKQAKGGKAPDRNWRMKKINIDPTKNDGGDKTDTEIVPTTEQPL